MTDQQVGGTGRRHAGVLVLVLAMLLAACSDGGQPELQPVEAATAPGTGEVPELPRVTPRPTDEEMDQPSQTAPTPPPRAGDVVLLHLEGPVTALDATDVVVRTELGREIARYRLPRAVSVYGGADSPYALVAAVDGTWARFDGTSRTLSLVSFPVAGGNEPTGPPRLRRGRVAVWDRGADRWLLRIDTGVAVDLDVLGEDVTVSEVSRDGRWAVLDTPSGLQVLATQDGALRSLEGVQASFDDARDLVLTVGAPDADGSRDVAIEAPDGSGRAVVGTASSPADPVPLPGGRILLAGPNPQVMAGDGELTPLAGLVSAGPPWMLLDDGATVLLSAGNALAWVDPTPDEDGVVTARLITGTTGATAIDEPGGAVAWALPAEDQAGLLLLDPATDAATLVAEDRQILEAQSFSADRRRIAVAATGEGPPVLLAADDGSVQPLLEGSVSGVGAVHPNGDPLALGSVLGIERTLVLTTPGGPPLVTIETGRAPAWVATT